MLAWCALLPVLAAMVAAMVLPGYFWVRASVRSAMVSAAAAPALTLAVITVLSVLYHAWEIRWSGPTVLPVLAGVSLAGALVMVLRVRRNPLVGDLMGDPVSVRPPLLVEAPTSRAYRILPRRTRVATWCMVGIGWVVAVLPLVVTADPADPVQQWDAVFHLNGVWNILDTGQAQPHGGLAPLYGGEMVSYPIAWHAFTALLATPTSVVQVANVTNLLLMGIWVVGCTAFTAVVSTSRVAVLAAPVLAGCMLSMPADALTMYSQWPNATGVAVLPGVAALAVVLGRRLNRSTVAGMRGALAHLPLLALVLLGVLGAAAAHPSALFSLVAILMAPLLASLWGMVRRSLWLRRRAFAGALVALGCVSVLAPLWVLTTSQLRAMGAYPRHGQGWAEAFSHFLTPFPPFDPTPGLAATVTIIALLMAAGVWATLSAVRAWDAIAWASFPDWRLPGAPAPVGKVDQGEAPAGEGDEGEAPTDDGCAGAPGTTGHAQIAAGPLGGPAHAGTAQGRTPAPVIALEADASREERTRVWELRRGEVREWIGSRPLVWPLASFLAMAGLVFLAYAPDNALRTFLLAPWYLDPRRIMAPQTLTMVPLAAMGFELAVNWIRAQRVRSADEHHSAGSLWRIGAILGVWLLALSLGGALDARIRAVTYVYDADNLGRPGMATSGELAMLRRMPQTLPADALVLGDPIAGAAYSEVIGQRRAVFPQLYQTMGDLEAQEVLVRRFNQIHTDPEVCQVVRELGITHFYQEEDGWYYQFKRSERFPGLYGVDVSRGFELVDSGGTAKLYRITACD
ncbi:MAG: hypothetical protein L0H81_00880 [Actinomyces sp.]|nr:hypothetical protein [Actinomyces sp.]